MLEEFIDDVLSWLAAELAASATNCNAIINIVNKRLCQP